MSYCHLTLPFKQCFPLLFRAGGKYHLSDFCSWEMEWVSWRITVGNRERVYGCWLWFRLHTAILRSLEGCESFYWLIPPQKGHPTLICLSGNSYRHLHSWYSVWRDEWMSRLMMIMTSFLSSCFLIEVTSAPGIRFTLWAKWAAFIVGLSQIKPGNCSGDRRKSIHDEGLASL